MNEHIKVESMQPAQRLEAAQRWRKRMTYLSAFLFVVIPSVIAGFYFMIMASDQYAVQVRFAVRGPEGASSTDMLSQVAGLSVAGSTITDSYILMDYLRSRQLLEDLSKRVDFEAIYNPPNADVLAAFEVRNSPIESLVEHWKQMVQIDFDTTSKIIVMEIRSFTPEHSKKLADETLKLSEALINRLSERSRNDSLRLANGEVKRQEERMRRSAKAMRAFREKTQDIDPTSSLAAQIARLSQLESELNGELAKLSTNLTYMKPDSPVIQYSRSKIKGLEKQIDIERAKRGQGSGPASANKGSLSGVFEDYQTLQTEMEFAQKAYVLAQQSLETARVTANQQQRYLATFILPSLPQAALYPQRMTNTAIAFLLCFCFWFIGLMIVYGIRDHAR